MEFGVQGLFLAAMAQDSVFSVECFGLRVHGSEFWIWGLRFGVWD